MSLNVPAVVVDSAVASVIFALGVAWAPVVVMVSVVSSVPAAAVLTAVDVPEAKTLLWLGFCCSAVLTTVDFAATAVSKVSMFWMLLESLLFWASLVLLVYKLNDRNSILV